MFKRSLMLAAILVAATATSPNAAAAVQCSAWASPNGSDSNPGTHAQPVQKIPRLIAALDPGQAGCLVNDPGTPPYSHGNGELVVNDEGGTSGNPVTIRSERDDQPPARIFGAMLIGGHSHDIVFERLGFYDAPAAFGPGSTLIKFEGDRITLRDSDITYSRGICIGAGMQHQDVPTNDPTSILSEDIVIERDRIHDCGRTSGVSGSGVHGIYLNKTDRAIVRDNLIVENNDRGLQLYPDADDTLIVHNVLDGNGSNFNMGSVPEYSLYPERTMFRDNVVTNARVPQGGPTHGDDSSIHGFMPSNTPDIGNAVTGNCVYQEDPGNRMYTGYGYSRSGNIDNLTGALRADQIYVDRVAGDYRIKPDGPCAGKGPRPDGDNGEDVPPGNPPAGDPPPSDPPAGDPPPADPPAGAPAPSVEPAGPAATAPLKLDVSKRLVRSGRSIAVNAGCPAAACTLGASGSVSVRGRALKLGRADAALESGKTTILRLRLPAAASRLRGLRVRVSIEAFDAAGHRITRQRSGLIHR